MSDRVCSSCDKSYKHYGQRSSLCKPCKRSYDREYYKTKVDKVKKVELNKQRKLGIYKKLKDFCKDNPCKSCGEDDYVVLDFDHIDREDKSYGISEMVRLGFSWENILKELGKCQVLCANCHRRKTAEQMGWYI